MEEATRMHKDAPFGWVLWLQELHAAGKARRAPRKAAAIAEDAKPRAPPSPQWVVLR